MTTFIFAGKNNLLDLSASERRYMILDEDAEKQARIERLTKLINKETDETLKRLYRCERYTLLYAATPKTLSKLLGGNRGEE